jgi:plasmid stabilization system protein ParE
MADFELRLHPAALAEAERARDWYRERSPVAALGFLGELDRAIERIAESPHSWPSYVKGTRRYLLARFPFSIVYRTRDRVIEVFAIAHHRRRPGYWSDRRRV